MADKPSDMFAWSRLPGIGKVYWPVKIVDSEGTSITVYSSSDDAYFTVKEANILEWGKHLSLLEKGKVMLRKKPNSLKAFLDDFEWILTQLEQSQPRDELSTHQSKNQQVESKLSETGTSSLPGSLTSVSQPSGIQHDERPLSGSQLSESPFSTCLQPVSFSLEGQSTNPQSKSLLPVSLYRNPQPESHALSPLPEIQIPVSPSTIHQTENQLCAKLAKTLLQERHFNKEKPLPLPNDIERLNSHLNSAIAELDYDEVNYKNYLRVAELHTAKLVMYNRRRTGEIEAIRLQDYKSRRSGDDENSQVIGTMTSFERQLLKTQAVLEVRGKTGRGVPVIIPGNCFEGLEYLANMNIRNTIGVQENLLSFCKKR